MGYDLIDRVVARRRSEREDARKRVLARTLELLAELAPHAYTYDLDPAAIALLVDKAHRARPLVPRDAEAFLERLRAG